MEYYPGFNFKEGVYLELNDFRENQPALERRIEKRGSDLWILSDSSEEMIPVDPNKVWGYCLGNSIYLSYDEAYWRLISIGTLCHFSAILVTSFQTVDAFGFPVTQYSKSLQHMFLDTRSGEIYALKTEFLKPFLEEDPILAERFERQRKKKTADLIMALKAYNQLNPIEFPYHE